MDWLDTLKFDDNGLMPAIAQDFHTGRILMMAWMNRESLRLTAEKMQAVYWSRSRGKLWHKGESSGHFQQVHEIRLDCDADVIVLSVTQVGGIACHTGRQSCFYRLLADDHGQLQWQITDAVIKDPDTIYGDNAKPTHEHSPLAGNSTQTSNSTQTPTTSADILTALDEVLIGRKNANPDSSYVASLYHKGINKILEKVGEESVETIIAAKDYAAQNTESNLNDLIYETADLWFHSIVMLGYFDLNPQLIIDELGRRQGLSGLVEKANRNKV